MMFVFAMQANITTMLIRHDVCVWFDVFAHNAIDRFGVEPIHFLGPKFASAL